jgi:hypothetical protein
MPAGPYITFTRFASAGSPKLRPWHQHQAHVIGASLDVATVLSSDCAVVVWQLVSGNNRILGRGAHTFATIEESAMDAEITVREAAALTVTRVGEPSRGSYGWYLALDGDPALICSRWYATERDRRYTIAHAIEALPVAVLRTAVRTIHPDLMTQASRGRAR